MAYDKSKEKTLTSREVPDYEGKPEWGGSVLKAVQYEDKKPMIVVERYRVDRNTGEKKFFPFVSIPSSAIPKLTADMRSLAEYIDQKYPKKTSE